MKAELALKLLLRIRELFANLKVAKLWLMMNR